MFNVDEHIDEINEALDRIRDDYTDHASSALDDLRVARKAVFDCIEACTSAYIGDTGPVGSAFHNFAEQLRDADRLLSRVEGELAT